MTTEIWFPVAGYEGLYEISDQLRVRSLRHGGRILYGVGQSRFDLVNARGERQRVWLFSIERSKCLFTDVHENGENQ
jgi:hypothetical protein